MADSDRCAILRHVCEKGPDWFGACMAPLVLVEVAREVSFGEWYAEMNA